MLINKGKYNGEQIVPEEWVKQTIDGASEYPGYSYQWWLLQTEEKEFMAQGILGQYLYINPSKNIIMVRMGKNWGKEVNWWSIFSTISDSIEDK